MPDGESVVVHVGLRGEALLVLDRLKLKDEVVDWDDEAECETLSVTDRVEANVDVAETLYDVVCDSVADRVGVCVDCVNVCEDVEVHVCDG